MRSRRAELGHGGDLKGASGHNLWAVLPAGQGDNASGFVLEYPLPPGQAYLILPTTEFRKPPQTAIRAESPQSKHEGQSLPGPVRSRRRQMAEKPAGPVNARHRRAHGKPNPFYDGMHHYIISRVRCQWRLVYGKQYGFCPLERFVLEWR
jgi:hypothetical protein